MMKKLLEKEFLRFLIIGSSTFVIDFSINNLIVLILQTDPTHESVIANMISVPIAFIYNFTFSSKWTFKNTIDRKKKFLKFLGVGIFNYIVSTFLIGLLVEYLTNSNLVHSHTTIQAGSKFLIMSLMTFWSYIIYKFWVFK
ncbi:MAG: GtrA family protein [Ignavibacteriae bacterium]|nr:GtrA family protein [Ignavibacteriota bacterium]